MRAIPSAAQAVYCSAHFIPHLLENMEHRNLKFEQNSSNIMISGVSIYSGFKCVYL